MTTKPAPRRITKAERESLESPATERVITPLSSAPTKFVEINLDLIHPDPDQPRKYFDEQKIAELADSINADEPEGRKRGVIQPILVRPLAGGRWKIVVGERRWRAARLAGLLTIPAQVRDMGDDEALDLQLAENADRDDLSPLEEAAAYAVKMSRPGMTFEKLAAHLARPVRHVRKRLSLNNLLPESRAAFEEGRLPLGQTEELARLAAEPQREAFAHAFKDWPPVENGQAKSVAELREWIKRQLFLQLSAAPFDVMDAELIASAGPCSLCPKRTGNNPALFPDVQEGQTCTDRSCYELKKQTHLANRRAEVQAETHQEPLRVSDVYYASREKDVLGQDSYRKVETPTECAFAQPAVIEDGEKAGVARHVCVADECPEHGKRGLAGKKLSAAEAEQKRAEKLRETAKRKVFQALPKLTLRLDAPEMRARLAWRLWEAVGPKAELMKLLGWPGDSWRPEVRERIRALQGAEQDSFIAACLLMPLSMHAYDTDSQSYRNELAEALPDFGLDWAALEREAEIDLELKAAKKKPCAPAGGYVREFGVGLVADKTGVTSLLTEVMVYRAGNSIAAITLKSEEVELFPTLAEFHRQTNLTYIGDADIPDETLTEWRRGYDLLYGEPFVVEFENRRTRLANMTEEGQEWTELAGSLRAYLEKWQPAYDELQRVWGSFPKTLSFPEAYAKVADRKKAAKGDAQAETGKPVDLLRERRDAINAAIKGGEEVSLLPGGNQDGAWRVVKAGATLATLELWVVGETRGSKHVVTPEDILTTFAQPGAVNEAKKL